MNPVRNLRFLPHPVRDFFTCVSNRGISNGVKPRTKTALGIDISETIISLALLKRDKNGIELLKAASAPVPDGAIKDGNVEDAALLFKAVNELKTRNKIQASQAAVSLFARPMLVQIMDMPRQVPTNIRQFVQNEVKRCVALTGKEIALDFCGIGLAGRPRSRLFVVATEGQKVAELVKACNQARLNVEAIEPPLLAYTRAFYAERIAGKFDCNVLLAILNGSALTLCVFKKQALDFVRTKDISLERVEPSKLCQWLAEEINAIIRFYDVEFPEASGKWEITVVADSVQLPDDAEEFLKAKVAGAELQVRTTEDAYQDTPVGQSRYVGANKPSSVAIGLAMRLLGINGSDLRINLLPPESAEVKSIKKHLLITANIVAAVLPLMILTAGVVSLMTKKVNQGIAYKKQPQLSQDTRALLRERELVDRQIKQLSGGPERLKGILGSRQEVDWAHLLEDIRSRTPKALRITKLHSKDNSRMSLEGLALSYEAVHLFVDMLNKSQYINSASLSQTEKDNEAGGLVRYSINCWLNREKKNS